MTQLTLTLSYGVIVLIGGLIGFFTANSLPSLIASSIFSALLFLSSWGLSKGDAWGYYLAFVTGGILSLFFINRFFQTYATVPLVMAIVSLAFIALLFFKKD